MATIILRNLDDRVAQRLRERAARKGRSMSAELRQIVAEAVAGPASRPDLKKLAAQVRALSSGRRHTPAERLVRESRRER
jgi:plasmid stability protein